MIIPNTPQQPKTSTTKTSSTTRTSSTSTTTETKTPRRAAPFCLLALLTLILLFSAACSSFRGVPSHGGGKRFDEEQRIVSASMREALREMDLIQLRGKRVRVDITHMTTFGSGNATWGGLQDIGFSTHRLRRDQDYIRYDADQWNYNLDTLEGRDAWSLRYRPYMGYYTSNVNTDPDMVYFAALLNMKLRHLGADLVHDNPDVTLHILVDAMGTNRSRIDYLLAGRDIYRATCEITYYAEMAQTGELLIEEAFSAGEATYDELSVLFFGVNRVRRGSSLLDEPPFLLPLNAVNREEGRLDEIEKRISRVVEEGKAPPPDLKEEYMDLLSARARLMLESGHPIDVKGAENVLNRMRAIDPSSPALRQIESEYQDKLDHGQP